MKQSVCSFIWGGIGTCFPRTWRCLIMFFLWIPMKQFFFKLFLRVKGSKSQNSSRDIQLGSQFYAFAFESFLNQHNQVLPVTCRYVLIKDGQAGGIVLLFHAV